MTSQDGQLEDAGTNQPPRFPLVPRIASSRRVHEDPSQLNYSRPRRTARDTTNQRPSPAGGAPTADAPPRTGQSRSAISGPAFPDSQRGMPVQSMKVRDTLHSAASSSEPADPISDGEHAMKAKSPGKRRRTPDTMSTTMNYPKGEDNGSDSRLRLDNYRAWVHRQRKRADAPRVRFEKAFDAAYQKWIIEGILRQRPLPPSVDGRHIALDPGAVRSSPLTDERRGKSYISNFIRSSRYTIWSFLPKQIYFQFSKLANFYFLVIGIVQVIPGLSTTGTYTTIAPLLVFVSLSIAKEGWDDYRRYQMDKAENRAVAWVYDPEKTVQGISRKQKILDVANHRARKGGKPDIEAGMTELGEIGQHRSESSKFSRIRWQDIRVGDILRLRRDDDIPADMMLLRASGENGIAYIDTMALDGETNLKIKQACPLLANRCDDIAKLRDYKAEAVTEDPNPDLYNFEGKITMDGETMPLTMNEVVYRGSTLRNTKEAVGLVINTGEECKIRMNATKEVRTKAPKIQYLLNRIVLLLVFFVIVLTFAETGGYYLWRDSYESKAWYLDGAEVPFYQIWFGYIIAFNTLIPISLYVSLEIVKVVQFFFLDDIAMYDPETDTPVRINTTTILENLGQVSYIFSDKTGTLTENKMHFRKLTVAGTAWLHDMDLQKGGSKAMPDEASESKGAPMTSKSGIKGGAGEQEPMKTPLIDDHGSMNFPAGSNRAQNTTAWEPHSPQERKTEDLVEYTRTKPNSAASETARQFFLCIALCHTCLPEKKENGEIGFQAASPDELALVQAAQDLGYSLIERSRNSITLQFTNPEGRKVTEIFEVLEVIEFSSQRKRMSIIIRLPNGRICVFCKGADNIILPRLRLANLAKQKAADVERRASHYRSLEAERNRQRRSFTSDPRNSMTKRNSFFRMNSTRNSNDLQARPSMSDDFDTWLKRRQTQEPDNGAGNGRKLQSPRNSFALSPTAEPGSNRQYSDIVDESLATDDSLVLERCFQHISEFASDGLRTLLFAYRYMEDSEYSSWKDEYRAATTSLVNRQQRIEEVAESIERNFELAGATAIEDKLQKGVPETIDKLRRANIKIWMLTGDKRETAINIAHSARLVKPFSELYILDATVGDVQEKITSTLVDIGNGMVSHSVLVVDGHTLGIIEQDESLSIMFYDLVVRMDSVICCRASPSQKASLVKSIRDTVPSSLTLAIGDGANDIAMIQASHVGIGISGREGLQAARVADYAIGQFRFLQPLLLVHGRWLYLRTAKYFLATFWKELVFYILQAQYQRWNGYTGTSIYEAWSLTVFNVLFTSLPVILLGIFEQDLSAEILLARPELYTIGQRSTAFNFKKYIAWTFMGAVDTVVIYLIVWGIFRETSFTDNNSLFPLGQLAFTAVVVIINIKILILECHHKTWIPITGFTLSILAWFLWNLIIGAIRTGSVGPYIIQGAFIHEFGNKLSWWATVGAAVAAVTAVELGATALHRIYFPTDQHLLQEMEQQGSIQGLAGPGSSSAEEGRASMTTTTVGGEGHDVKGAIEDERPVSAGLGDGDGAVRRLGAVYAPPSR